MIQKRLLQTMYNRGLSMMEIARVLHMSHSTVAYWMERHHVLRRSMSDAIYRKHNPFGHPFQFKSRLNRDEQFLLGLGLGLFWGEGMKLDCYAVRLGNTDPLLILRFRDFLENICGVSRDKLRYSLQIFGDVDVSQAVQFWCDFLSIRPKQLGKPSLVMLRGKGTYKRKNKFGVLQIACYNKHLKAIVDRMIGALKTRSYAGVAQLVEHTHGGSRYDSAHVSGNRYVSPE